MGAPSDGKGKKKQNPDISKLWKATPTRIPDVESAPEVIPHQQEAQLERLHGRTFGGFGAIVFVFAIVLYMYTLYGVPVFNDDMNLHAFQRSFDVSVFWAQQVANVLSSPLAQPWLKLTYGLDAISFPQMPAWYHLVNVMLHAFASLYFYLFVLQLGLRLRAEKRWTQNAYVFALCAALLYACHPLATGAAAYISGRGALLTACNYFLCLNLFMLAFYAQRVGRIVAFYILSLIFYFVGVACGYQMLSLPLTLLVLASVLKPEKLSWSVWLKERYQDFGAIVLYGVTTVITLFSPRVNVLDNGVDLMQMTHWGYAASCCKSYVTYFLRCFFVPAGLSVEPPLTVAQSFADPLAILGAILLLGGATASFGLRHKPLLAVALAFATLPFIADLCFLQHEFVSDQKFYLVLSGLCLIACNFVLNWSTGLRASHPRQSIALGLVLIAVLSGLTVWREKAWLVNDGIWTGKQENISPRALAEYARVNLVRGSLPEAEKSANEALQKDPECPNAHEVLGQLYAAKKLNDKAVKEFEMALESCAPRKTAVERRVVYQEQLIKTCIAMHDYEKAQQNVGPALMVYPGSSNLHLYAGQILLGQMKYLPALQELQTAYTIEPNNPWVVEPLVESMLDVGGSQYVQAAYQLSARALKVILSPKLKCLFARAAIDLGHINQAVPKLQLVLKDEPDNAEAIYLTSLIYHLGGEEKTALAWRKRALAINPNIEKIAVIHGESARRAVPPSTQPAPGGASKPAAAAQTALQPQSSSEAIKTPQATSATSAAATSPAATTTPTTTTTSSSAGAKTP